MNNAITPAKRNSILKWADKYGTVKAAKRYNIPVMRIAAWKAHRTMGTYK